MNEGTNSGKSTICLKAAVLKDPQTAFTFFFYMFRTRGLRKTVVYTGLVMHVKHTISYHNCMYNRLPENEPSGSKHIGNIKKN